ncbi:MAG: amidohydrolase family protein [Acidimicrobiales bacterium]
MTGPVVVDFHAHHFPEGLPDLAATTGDQRWPSLVVDDSPRLMQGATVFRQVRPPCFDVTSRVAELDASGVERQVISPVPVTLVDWAPPKEAAAFLAAQNDGLIDASRRSDGRLLALGAVPLQDPDLAIAEMARIMSAGMVGIEITAMVDGCELDDPRFEPFWAAAAQEQVPVFIHPAHQRIARGEAACRMSSGSGCSPTRRLLQRHWCMAGCSIATPISASLCRTVAAPSDGPTPDCGSWRLAMRRLRLTSTTSFAACGSTPSCSTLRCYRSWSTGSVPTTSCSGPTIRSSLVPSTSSKRCSVIRSRSRPDFTTVASARNALDFLGLRPEA